jgi:hypothetical protein
MQDGRCVHALASCTVSPFVLQCGATQLMGGRNEHAGLGTCESFPAQGRGKTRFFQCEMLGVLFSG